MELMPPRNSWRLRGSTRNGSCIGMSCGGMQNAPWPSWPPVAPKLWWTPLHVCDSAPARSEEHTSELKSLMRISYAVLCLKKKNNTEIQHKNIIAVAQSTATVTTPPTETP